MWRRLRRGRLRRQSVSKSSLLPNNTQQYTTIHNKTEWALV